MRQVPLPPADTALGQVIVPAGWAEAKVQDGGLVPASCIRGHVAVVGCGPPQNWV